jgi:hypothetical protein
MPAASLPQPPAIPQMAYTPPAMPQMAPPRVPTPPAAVPTGKASNTVLIAIFCLLAFLAGGLLVFLLMHRG